LKIKNEIKLKIKGTAGEKRREGSNAFAC